MLLFLDVQQSVIGSCSLEDVAVRVLTRVIGHCPHRNQLLIDCGWSGLRYLHQYFLVCFVFAEWTFPAHHFKLTLSYVRGRRLRLRLIYYFNLFPLS